MPKMPKSNTMIYKNPKRLNGNRYSLSCFKRKD